MKKRILFIINPIAGGGRDLARFEQIIDRVLKKYDQEIEHEVQVTTARGDAVEKAKNALNRQYNLVVAVGGDGTVNEVACALVGSEAALGIIPIGSGDGIARGLGIPLTLRRAIRTLCQGRIKKIDVGLVQGRYFFAVAGLGFDAVVGKMFDESPVRGALPYFYFGIREFFNYEPVEYQLKFENQVIRKKALILTVANLNQFGNHAIIAPSAKPDDGLLDICLIKDINAFRAAVSLPKLFTGNLVNSKYYEYFQTREVEITRPFPAPIHVDGEVFDGPASVTIKLLPKALSVIIPLAGQAGIKN